MSCGVMDPEELRELQTLTGFEFWRRLGELLTDPERGEPDKTGQKLTKVDTEQPEGTRSRAALCLCGSCCGYFIKLHC